MYIYIFNNKEININIYIKCIQKYSADLLSSSKRRFIYCKSTIPKLQIIFSTHVYLSIAFT